MVTGLWDGVTSTGLPLAAASEPLLRRLGALPSPSSTAELRLSTDEVSWLRAWFSQLTVVPRSWLTPDALDSGSPKPPELFGLLFLVLAAETVREHGDEESTWPFVQRVFPAGHTLRTRFFRRDQPSPACKRILEAAARCFHLRHAFEINDAQRYYSTLKLQVGFTFDGGIHRLGDWLDGLGTPQSVQTLLGTTAHVHLESESFRQMWGTLKDFRRGKVPEASASSSLKLSPWLRPHWIDPLLQAATHHSRTYKPSSGKEADDLVELALEWPAGHCPRLFLKLSESKIESLFSDKEIKDLCFDADGRVVDRWLRQPNGAWHGSRKLAIDQHEAQTPDLQPAALTLSTSLGNQSHVVDLTALGTRDDVVVFDLSTSRTCPADDPMATNREYALVCASDLALAGASSKERSGYGPRRIFRLEPGWSPNVRLVLDDLSFWEPLVEGRARNPLPRVKLTTLLNRETELGSKAVLTVDGLPNDVLAGTLRVGSALLPLSRESGDTWRTSQPVLIDASLALGLERVRIEAITPTGRRVYRAKLALNLFGLAVLRGGNPHDGQASWVAIPPGSELNIAIQSGHLRFFAGELDSLAILEGTSVRSDRVPTRPIAIDKLSLGGWGGKLTLWGKPDRPLATSVQDRGRLFSYFYFGSQARPEPPQIRLASPIEPDVRHSLLVWRAGATSDPLERLTLTDLTVKADGTVWQLLRRIEPQAIGLAFDGVCLGSWWDKARIAAMLRTAMTANLDNAALTIFALLRWFKAPVLSQEIRSSVQSLVNIRPLDFARSWLGSEGLPSGLKHRGHEAGIQDVIRELLWKWKPRTNPQTLDRILLTFAPHDPFRSPSREVAALVATATICPPLLRDLTGGPLHRFATTALRTYLGLGAGFEPNDVKLQRARLEGAYRREVSARGCPTLMSAEERMDSTIPCGVAGRRLLGAQLLLALSSDPKMSVWAKSTH